MIGDTNTSLGGKIAFEMEYDGQKYDGYDVLISTIKKNGDEEDFHSSTGSEWTIPLLKVVTMSYLLMDIPKLNSDTGKFEVYSDVSPSGTNFITGYNFDDNLTIHDSGQYKQTYGQYFNIL